MSKQDMPAGSYTIHLQPLFNRIYTSGATGEKTNAHHVVLRHLFSEAVNSSVTDKRWSLLGTFTDPGNKIETEYEHEISGDRIKCSSYGYDEQTGKYMKHDFSFTVGEKI